MATDFGRNRLVRQLVIGVPRPHRAKIPQVATAPIPYNPLSLVFLMVALLLGGFAILALTVLTGTKLLNPGGYPDPFMPYEYLLTLPGQPIAAIRELPCQQPYLSLHFYESFCTFTLDSEYFKSVEIVGQHGAVTEVLFAVKSVQVVDLVQRWGPPQRIQSDRGYVAYWDSGWVAFCAPGRRFHNQLDVKMVLFRQSV